MKENKSKWKHKTIKKKKRAKKRETVQETKKNTEQSNNIVAFIITKYITISQRVERQQMKLKCFKILALFRKW